MKLKDHLDDDQKKKLNELKKEERINWKEIMGMNRDTYKRKNGAIRRK